MAIMRAVSVAKTQPSLRAVQALQFSANLGTKSMAVALQRIPTYKKGRGALTALNKIYNNNNVF